VRLSRGICCSIVGVPLRWACIPSSPGPALPLLPHPKPVYEEEGPIRRSACLHALRRASMAEHDTAIIHQLRNLLSLIRVTKKLGEDT
jgi:hypothetical protein